MSLRRCAPFLLIIAAVALCPILAGADHDNGPHVIQRGPGNPDSDTTGSFSHYFEEPGRLESGDSCSGTFNCNEGRCTCDEGSLSCCVEACFFILEEICGIE